MKHLPTVFTATFLLILFYLFIAASEQHWFSSEWSLFGRYLYTSGSVLLVGYAIGKKIQINARG